MKKFSFIVLIIISVLFFCGCEQLSNVTKKLGKTSESKTNEITLAKVNKWALPLSDFQEQVEAIIKANDGKSEIAVERLGLLARTMVPAYLETIDLATLEGKKVYLDLLVNLELLAQEAEKRGLAKEPDIARSIRQSTVEILDFSLLNRVLKDITVTPLDVENFYNNEYKKTLENIEQRRVREIVVDSEAKAKEMLVELLRGGNFASLASANSIVESSKKGGDLGYLVYQPNMKFTKFWEAVLTLDKGQTSSVFKNPDKQEYYIVMVEDIKKGEPESLNKIYDQLEFLLKQRKSFEAINNLLKDIKAKSEVGIKDNLLK
ncbi:MAG: peptidylprolyl isomerase [Candidatus Omnitrophica bacterium]|jgi:peptidyl-prolyl cis-trans isomerase C|nr:peptidylprolyl isomerase [Candidatus Omnitrophota bacterium]